MKLLYCQDCGDIIAPNPVARAPRWCRCRRHAVWWENPGTGVLRLHDSRGPHSVEHWPNQPRAYVLGITNMLLHQPGSMSAELVEQMIDAHEDFYLFKQFRSLIIRIRPGESGDTSWAVLPDGGPA